ncbi:MAG: glycosyltransferase [Methylacidiphilales bacterium]|nr:glycosyltransferase [Candidatus Methylacidiphilales bacterium]
MYLPKLVSIIIPCFNASRWLSEAIDSCLQQTYSNIEIIIIDDGSTDNSWEIIKNYSDKYSNKIKCRSISHRGGNHARNLAISLSNGEYIQFLDADDYILPEKIEHQVRFLETTDADVVYGDWQYQYHRYDGTIQLSKIEISGVQTDILESLLATWWVAVAALLYKRSSVDKSDGWDENLPAVQDRDFFLSVVINGAKVKYQSGCYSIYRRYGDVTVSTCSKPRWIACHCLVLEKTESKLLELQRLSTNYRRAIAACYFDLARTALFIDYSLYLKLVDAALNRFPDFEGNSTRRFYHLIRTIIGFRRIERIICLILITKKAFRSMLNIFTNQVNYLV